MSYAVLEKLIEAALFKSLKDQLDRLPALERKIFLLYLDGYVAEEITRLLGGGQSLLQIKGTIKKVKVQILQSLSKSYSPMRHPPFFLN